VKAMNAIPLLKGVIGGILDCDYYWHCLDPKHENYFLTVEFKDYVVCPICNIKCCVGSGIHDDLDENMALSEEFKKNLLKNYNDFSDKWINWQNLTKEQKKATGWKWESEQ